MVHAPLIVYGFGVQSGGSMKDRERDSDRHDANTSADKGRAPGARKPATPDAPRTTTGKWTTPKFGSAGSGGAELEPGPRRKK
jgi:hypothetical protein